MRIVALPANIFFSVSVHINFRQTLDAAGSLVMTFSAKFPFVRLRRNYRPGRCFMLFRRGVANGAGHQGMVGRRLGPFNLRMAGSAGTGGPGRGGVVRVMARCAWLPRVVRVRIDLREACRPR